jgi:hypothetical protein
MKVALFTGALVLAASSAFAQQIPVGTRVGDIPASGYDNAGRRDPFVTLIAPKRTATGAPGGSLTRPRNGLSSLTLADVAVTGLTKTPKGMLAILQGPDKQSFVLHVKDQLFDASVKSIDTQGVVFVQTLDGRPQEVRKTLRAAAEVIR